MDPIAVFIANTHRLLGHDLAAAFMACAPGDRDACVLCQFEAHPTAERKQAVVAAIGRPVAP